MTPKLRFPEFVDEWKATTVDGVFAINSNESNLPSEFYYIDLESVKNGRLSEISLMNLEDAPSRAQRRLEGQCILFQMVRPYQKNNLLFQVELLDGIVVASTGYSVLKPTDGSIKYYFTLLQNDRFVNRVLIRSTGSNYPAINSSELKRVRLYDSQSVSEKDKLGELFSLIDQKINLLTKKKEALETYKKGLMQKIFSQELRFKREDGTDYSEWKKVRIGDVFTVTRGKVLATSLTKQQFDESFTYPVYSSQTKANGLMGFYDEYLFEDAITWTTDGANAGEVRFRRGKFYCTNVCGVLLSEKYANTAVSIAINRVTHKYVSYVGNPKLMNGVMSEIALPLPTSAAELKHISSLFEKLEDKVSMIQKRIETVDKLKQGLIQQMFV